MQVAGGGAMVGFVGSRRPKAWAAFYDDWFARRGWEVDTKWQRSAKAWHVRYVAPPSDPAASVDVHFCNDDSGRTTGLLIFTNKGTVPIFPEGKWDCPPNEPGENQDP